MQKSDYHTLRDPTPGPAEVAGVLRPDPLRFTSCQAPIAAEAFCAGVASYVGNNLGTVVEFVDDIPWPEPGIAAPGHRDLRSQPEPAMGRGASRFAVVTDADYDPIRRMAREAERIKL